MFSIHYILTKFFEKSNAKNYVILNPVFFVPNSEKLKVPKKTTGPPSGFVSRKGTAHCRSRLVDIGANQNIFYSKLVNYLRISIT